VLTETANTTDYNAFYRGNLTNLSLWLQRPDTASTIANTDMILPDGGAAWSLLHHTVYADGLGIPGVSSRYGFRCWDFHHAETSGGFGPYPLRIAALAGGSIVTGMFRLLSPTGSLVSFPGARLYVLRTQ